MSVQWTQELQDKAVALQDKIEALAAKLPTSERSKQLQVEARELLVQRQAELDAQDERFNTDQLNHQIMLLTARRDLIIKYRQAIAKVKAATNEADKMKWAQEVAWVREELSALL